MLPGPLRLVFRQSPATYFPNGARAVFAYLLRDLFTTAVSAGSVNGAAIQPGPGTYVVTDTNSKISISGQALNFATGEAANDSVWYPTQVRTTGKFLIATININTASMRFGWDTNQLTTLSTNAINFSAGGNINIRDSGTSGIIAVYSTATDYRVAIVLRPVGMYVFIKGGAFTKNILIWASTAIGDNTTPVFPDVNSDSTTGVFTVKNLGIPVNTFLPTPLAYDTFTRADGALGTTEAAGPESQVIVGKAWTGASFTISTNKAIATPTTGADVIVNGGFGADTDWNKGAGWTIAAGTAVATAASSDITAAVAPLTLGVWYQTAFTQGGFTGGTANIKLGTTAFPTHAANATFTETGRATSTAFAITGAGLTDTIDNVSALPLTLSTLFASIVSSVADVWAIVNVTLESASSGKQAGLVLNLDSTSSPANFIIVYLDGNGNCKADECVAGVYTNKISAAVTYSAGAPLTASRQGKDLRVTYNGSVVGSLATMTANTNVMHGLFSTSPLSSLDVFYLLPKGTSSEYSTLDNYQ